MYEPSQKRLFLDWVPFDDSSSVLKRIEVRFSAFPRADLSHCYRRIRPAFGGRTPKGLPPFTIRRTEAAYYLCMLFVRGLRKTALSVCTPSPVNNGGRPN